ncbi:glycosyltransferase family 2 protein [Actinotalea ferrariae]|nr:glycosyltransferase family 2 protein [Actinotalea ferrariae]
MRYSVVVPVYTNEGTLAELLERLCAISERLGGGLEAVLVVDGSPDSSLEVLRELLPRTPLPSRLLVHARNFGSFAAIRTGMAAARGEYVGVMAADLQEPPELMEAFFARLRTGEVDVVVGRRESRDDPALSALMSRVFWWLYRKAINPEFPPGGVDVFGCTREVALRLLSLNEAHSSLVGLLYWVGYRREEVPYSRLARTSGRSGWTLRKRVRYLLDSVFSFTDIPITMLSTVGAAGAALTALVAVVVFVGWATGRITETGYTPLMLTILFSTFSMLSALGIVGSYVWRAFENSKQRPGSIARTMETFHADD